eukprot:366038-Chlamydomonas_euryale.AAC.8
MLGAWNPDANWEDEDLLSLQVCRKCGCVDVWGVCSALGTLMPAGRARPAVAAGVGMRGGCDSGVGMRGGCDTGVGMRGGCDTGLRSCAHRNALWLQVWECGEGVIQVWECGEGVIQVWECGEGVIQVCGRVHTAMLCGCQKAVANTACGPCETPIS